MNVRALRTMEYPFAGSIGQGTPMIGRIMCLINRHRPRRDTVFRGAKGTSFGECRYCDAVIRCTSANRWVRKRLPLSEHDLDARHQQFEHRAQVRKSRIKRS